jgi:hypothetical protein
MSEKLARATSRTRRRCISTIGIKRTISGPAKPVQTSPSLFSRSRDSHSVQDKCAYCPKASSVQNHDRHLNSKLIGIVEEALDGVVFPPREPRNAKIVNAASTARYVRERVQASLPLGY